MPELPDIEVYVTALDRRVTGRTLAGVRLRNPFVLRTVTPTPDELTGRRVVSVERMGKRIVMGFEDDLFVALHLMVAGRLQWRKAGAGMPGKLAHAAFDFEHGTLLLTEASSRKRAAIHLIRGREALAALDRGGIEPLVADAATFAGALRRENHTLKRALTDPRLFSGIGNAYSDEILHRARMSPFRLTQGMTDHEIEELRQAVSGVLVEWTNRLLAECGTEFPTHVTAFHEGMAVHGRFGKPCPDCGTPVQRIVYAENECNYCPTCQTGGKLLADRALSRLLKDDWPRSLDALEETRDAHRLGRHHANNGETSECE